MAISYPVNVQDTAGKWRLLDTETSKITKLGQNGTWPVADGGAIPGLAENFVPLLVVDSERPAYDSRFSRVIATPVVSIANNQITTDWSIEDRPDEEKKSAVYNIEQEEFSKHLDPARLSVQNTLVLTAILRKLKGQNIPAGFQRWMDDFQERGEKIYLNRQKIEEFIAQIDAGTDPAVDLAVFEAPVVD